MCITVLYIPNQAHNCTLSLIKYSYAVDYYCMNYTAHFLALILPRKVRYTVYRVLVPLIEEIKGFYYGKTKIIYIPTSW